MNIADEILAYAAYLNAPKNHGIFDDPDEMREFEEDKAKAQAAMEVAWLNAKPVLT